MDAVLAQSSNDLIQGAIVVVEASTQNIASYTLV